MITKERLEELVKQGATIYTSRFKNPEKYKLYKDYFIDKDKLCACNKSHTAIECVIKLDKLFETEEDARWELEMTATRTETLKLPKWEYWQKVSKYGMYAMSFFDKEYHYCELQILETIKVVKWEYGRTVEFEKPATKENYISACKLCLRLFKGEEVC